MPKTLLNNRVKMVPLEVSCAAEDMFWNAAQFALEVHRGQKDKGGAAYYFHVLRVGTSLIPNWPAAIVGVLHDVFDKRPEIPLAAVQRYLPTVRAWDALLLLVSHPEQSWEQNIIELAQDPLANLVKRADITDNLRPERLYAAELAGHDMAPLVSRYHWGLHYLSHPELHVKSLDESRLSFCSIGERHEKTS